MKNTCSYFICAVAVQFLSVGIGNAQTIQLKAPPAGVAIDGNAKEWGDMVNTDAKTKVSYTLSNDKDNLYLVVKTKDPIQQSNILASGVALSVDPKGRKKTTYTVSFPVKADGDPAGYLNMQPTQIPGKVQLAKYRKIHVEGFKDMDNGDVINTSAQGIQTAVGYDGEYLIFEESVPLTLFHASADQMTKEWAYNIQLNAVERTEKSGVKNSSAFSGAGSAENHVGGSGRDKSLGTSGVNKIDPESDTRVTTVLPEQTFWGKFTLAK